MAKFYLRLEGVNISNYVFDTKDLSTIRGGGLILLNSIKDVENEFNQLNFISTGASSGLFEFEASQEEAGNLVRDIRHFLNNDKYKHATFVLNALAAVESENFVRDKETLIAHNRWQQMKSPFMAVPSQNYDTHVEPCAENKLRPAKEGGENEISLSVSERQNYGREQKQFFYEQQTERQIVSNQNQPRRFTKDFAGLATLTGDEKKEINPN